MITENNPPFNGKIYECAPGCDPVTFDSHIDATEALEILRYLAHESVDKQVFNFKTAVRPGAFLPLKTFDSIFSCQ